MLKSPHGRKLNSVAVSIGRSRFFAASLLIHIVIVAVLGSAVLFKAIQDKEAFIVSSGPEGGFLNEVDTLSSGTEDSPAEFEEPAASTMETSSPSQTAISTLIHTSPWTTIASMERATIGTNLSSFNHDISAATSSGGGRQGGGGGGGGMKSGSLFGRTIQATKLGVVFDVSFSTHKTIDSALSEIQRSFSDAILVLAPGCGMLNELNEKKIRGEVLSGHEYMEHLPKYQFDHSRFYMGVFLPTLLEKNQNFTRLWRDGIQYQRIFVLHLDRAPNPRTPLVSGTQLAFQFLAEKGVDTIWWFADFEDEIDEGVALKTARDLERRRIKVIQHDFDGGKQLDSKPKNILATVTKGEVIQGYQSNKH